MTATAKRRQTTPTVPSTIDSAQAKLVYLYLAQEREASVDDVADALGLRKLGLYDVLAALEADGHVDREGARTITFAD